MDGWSRHRHWPGFHGILHASLSPSLTARQRMRIGVQLLAAVLFACVIVVLNFPSEQQTVLFVATAPTTIYKQKSTLSGSAGAALSATAGAATTQTQPPPPSPPPPPPAASDPPGGINLTSATLAALTRGCMEKRPQMGIDGVPCKAKGLIRLLSRPPATRFDTSLRTPCSPDGYCVPFFYMLGSFHTGITDLYDRLLLAQPDDVFIPKARQDGSYPYYFSETHPWERMLWRGCDFGRCPRRRGVGAEPLSLKNNELPELAPGAPRAASRIFGEVTGGALTFTWSSAHSVLHFAWDKNQSA